MATQIFHGYFAAFSCYLGKNFVIWINKEVDTNFVSTRVKQTDTGLVSAWVTKKKNSFSRE